jgi:hypothetical protein
MIHVWAEGKEIQWWDEDKGCWVDTARPLWFDNEKYRVKQSNRHPNADIIHAWAEGQPVQYWSKSNGRWLDIDPLAFPEWDNYRVKPELNKGSFRVALVESSDGTQDELLCLLHDAEKPKPERFVKWLTPVIEWEHKL